MFFWEDLLHGCDQYRWVHQGNLSGLNTPSGFSFIHRTHRRTIILYIRLTNSVIVMGHMTQDDLGRVGPPSALFGCYLKYVDIRTTWVERFIAHSQGSDSSLNLFLSPSRAVWRPWWSVLLHAGDLPRRWVFSELRRVHQWRAEEWNRRHRSGASVGKYTVNTRIGGSGLNFPLVTVCKSVPFFTVPSSPGEGPGGVIPTGTMTMKKTEEH